MTGTGAGELIFRILVPIIYAVLAVDYLKLLIKNQRIQPARQLAVYAALVISLSALIFFRGINVHRCPFGNVFEGITFVLWFITLFYFVLEKITGEPWLGMILIPLNAVLSALSSVFLNAGGSLPDKFHSVYFPLHVSLALTGYCFFLFSFLAALIYLKQFKELKEKKQGFLYGRLPSLEKSERYVFVSALAGIILFAIGVYMGFVWSRVENVDFISFSAKAILTLGALGVYGVLVFLRAIRVARGKMVSYLSIMGFILIIMTLSLGRHGF